MLSIKKNTVYYVSMILLLLPILRSLPRQCKAVIYNLWLITLDDTPTFVLPNTIFGVCSVLGGLCLGSQHTSQKLLPVLGRLPYVFLFNWSNLLVFDLANQRLPDSAKEDSINKPWRPVPSGRMTSAQVRQSMLLAIPLVFFFNHFLLGLGVETTFLYTLTWLYNDLRGGDEDWILRNCIIACAFGCYNSGSMKVAAGICSSDSISGEGHTWIAIISAVILTTMHIQDLKDQAGDRVRGRQTAPIVLGESLARWTLAIPIIIWTIYCASFWQLSWGVFFCVLGLGGYVSWRCVCIYGRKADRITWQLWCFWTAALYAMPLVGRSG